MNHTYPQSKRYSSSAIASLVLGVLGFMSCSGALLGIPALICGHISLSALKRDNGLLGKGMAIAGVVMGYVLVVLTIGYGIFFYFVYQHGEELERERVEKLEKVSPEEAECIVILPKDHRPENPVPVAIWLHGYGWNPSELSLFEEDYQERANKLGIAFVGISATAERGEGGYEWSEDPVVDYAYLKSVLDTNQSRIKPDWPRVILFGFSQGAKVAGDVAGNHPDEFAGAILMSPGGERTSPDLPGAATENHKYQKYFCFVGAEEAYGNVSLTGDYARELKNLGATVVLKKYEGIEEHTTPPDYGEKLSEWLKTMLSAEAE